MSSKIENIIAMWNFMNLNINHRTVSTNLLSKTIEKMLSIPNFPNLIFKNKELFLEFYKLKKTLNDNSYITFNNLFINNKKEFPALTIELIPNIFKYKNSSDWNLILMNNKDQKFIPGLNFDFKTSQIENSAIPVVVSKHFGILNNLNINDTFDADLMKSHTNTNCTFIIKDIVKNDLKSNNIYSDYNLIFKNEKDKYYNTIFTNDNLIKIKDNELIINNNIFSFFKETKTKYSDIKFYYLFNNYNKFYSYLNFDVFSNKNFESYKINKDIVNEKNKKFYSLINLILIATFLIVAMLFFIISLLNFINNKEYINLLNAMGISGLKIIYSMNIKLMINIPIIIIFGSIIIWSIWKIVKDILFKKQLLYAPVFSIKDIIISSIVMIIIILLEFLFLIIINKFKK